MVFDRMDCMRMAVDCDWYGQEMKIV